MPFEIYFMETSAIINKDDKNEAITIFFKMIKDGKIDVENVGQIVAVKDLETGDIFPMRTVPTLLNLGLIDKNAAIHNIIEHLKFDNVEEANTFLIKACNKDMWVKDKIEEVCY